MEEVLIVCPLCNSVVVAEDEDEVRCSTCNNIINEEFDEAQKDN